MDGALSRRASLGAGLALVTTPTIGWASPQPRRLSNPKASAEARALYAYLWSLYGRKTLTGQQEGVARPGVELDYIEKVTRRQPAILGLDYIEPRLNAGVNERAIAWHRSGGIVTLCWHWGAPDIGPGYDNSKKDFDLVAALRPGTPQNLALHRDLARVADLLSVLRDHRVPVLWRPLHEFSGDWFWWGKHGPEAFKALWALMYDTFARQRGLDNLIWVAGWAGQNVDPAWYPGCDRVDVAGADIYADGHGVLAPMFQAVKAIVGEATPICLHENGPIPDPALLGPEADWLWFMTWHTRWLMDPGQNDPERLKAYYASERFLTKDELKHSI
ncbi:mannan endo-1,4-beta-mannosidase [Caulobacter sp. UNC279MFTsu5.1]|nr:mannan endo-1,4-beta-mannosidase [Caulobacter sp. UNC279MFTsu5.1]